MARTPGRACGLRPKIHHRHARRLCRLAIVKVPRRSLRDLAGLRRDDWPLANRAVARTLAGSAWKDGRPFSRSSAYCTCDLATARPVFLPRVALLALAPAFAPGSAARDSAGLLASSGSPPIKRRRRGHHMGPELGAHRPGELPICLTCPSLWLGAFAVRKAFAGSPLGFSPTSRTRLTRSGTDRCPDARSAHPFPAQRYLREGG